MQRQQNHIVGTTLVGCVPEYTGGPWHRVVIPQGVARIAGGAFSFRDNQLSVTVPDSVAQIDEKAFDTVKYTDLYGIPGGCAERFAREHSDLFHQVRFYSNAFPALPAPQPDAPRAARTGFDPALAGALLWETETAAGDAPVRLPRSLFVVEQQEHTDEKLMVFSQRQAVVMRAPGKLELEECRVTCDAHNIARHTPPLTRYAGIGFEALPGLIQRAQDARARDYAGMNADNWADYLCEASPAAAPSRHPLVRFAAYPTRRYSDERQPLYWYVLDVKGDKALLLSRDGLECRCRDDANVTMEKNGPFVNRRVGPVSPWRDSALRHWMNDWLLHGLFTEVERRWIAPDGPEGDALTCLSIAQFKDFLQGDPAAEMRPTGYAVGLGASVFIPTDGTKPEYLKNAGKGIWWLRDERGEGFMAAGVGNAACVDFGGHVISQPCYDGAVGVRPSLWIGLDHWRQTR